MDKTEAIRSAGPGKAAPDAGPPDGANGRTKADIETAADKPVAAPVNTDGIPGELRARPQWVCWKYTRRDGRWTKVPIDPKDGNNAKADDPSTWGTFEQALQRMKDRPHELDGVGYEFSTDDPFCGVDLDDAIDSATGEPKPWAAAIVNEFSSYTEVSPSRTGLKAYLRGKKTGDRCKTKYEDGEVEIYDRGRFFAVTGVAWPKTPSTVEDRQEQLNGLYDRIFNQPNGANGKAKKKPASAKSGAAAHDGPPAHLSDDQILDRAGRAKNADKFRALMAGDTSGHGDDDSAADAALCCMIAFYVKGAAQIERVFGRSKLADRDKWKDRPDYRARTIAYALSVTTEQYDPGAEIKHGAGEGENTGQDHKLADAAIIAGLLEKASNDPASAIDAALVADALACLARLCHDSPGNLEAFFRKLAAAGAKARDVAGLRQAVNRESKRRKEEAKQAAAQKATRRQGAAFTAALKCLLNYYDEKRQKFDGSIEWVKVGLPPRRIADRIKELIGPWPKRVGPLLFAYDPGPKPLYLETTPALFAYIARRLPSEGGNCITWGQGEDMVTQPHFHAFLRQTAEEFDAVECFPHHPKIDRHYYIHEAVKGGNGEKLRRLLDFFRPATGADEDLLHAFFLSLFWGGGAGARPAWLFTATPDDPEGGRGVGKSKVAQLAGQLVGGTVNVEANERMADVITRLLSPEALTKRILLLDNVKTLKFSWAELEALITSTTISGHRMYQGEGQRPNLLTVCITLNGAALSRDLAKRCNIVQMERAEYDATWEDNVKAYIERWRWDIVGDCLAGLRRQGAELPGFSRWGAWEAGVLSRVESPAACQEIVRQRQDEVDEDAGEADAVREFVAKALRDYGHNAEADVVFLPSDVIAEWVNAATGEKRPKNKACSYLNQLSVKGLRRSKNDDERGWRWTGEKATAGQKVAHLYQHTRRKEGATGQ